MAKITINDKVYYTDDFNEQQMRAYQEIQAATAELQRMDYVMAVVNARREFLASQIEAMATPKDQLELDLGEANADQ